jgi:Mrp family chromosome partitioning ATPase
MLYRGSVKVLKGSGRSTALRSLLNIGEANPTSLRRVIIGSDGASIRPKTFFPVIFSKDDREKGRFIPHLRYRSGRGLLGEKLKKHGNDMILVIASGKGGTGKTTAAVNLYG